MEKLELTLFVAGDTAKSTLAAAKLRHICESLAQGNYTLAIVDVLQDSAAAEREKILVTPTLIKRSPPPVRRLLGDLTATAKVVETLGLPIAATVEHAHESELR